MRKKKYPRQADNSCKKYKCIVYERNYLKGYYFFIFGFFYFSLAHTYAMKINKYRETKKNLP